MVCTADETWRVLEFNFKKTCAFKISGDDSIQGWKKTSKAPRFSEEKEMWKWSMKQRSLKFFRIQEKGTRSESKGYCLIWDSSRGEIISL